MPTHIRSLDCYILLLLVGALCATNVATAQEAHKASAGVSYVFVRTNVAPGCNCVGLNGGGGELQYAFTSHWAVLGDFTAAHRSGITPDGYSLTQLTYTAGTRFWPKRPSAHLQPFAEFTLGGSHALGSLAPGSSGIAGSSNAFVMQLGGGLQVRWKSHITIEPARINYLRTTFSNGGSNRQNDLRVSIGLLAGFGR